jgi:TolB-like protein/predicted metal-dependent HD superfamily phosphohydrolase
MPSTLSGYAYDIFISYRHKDNRGERWVSEFVNALRRELEKTFKEPITVYFDANLHDGLLETHHVDKSLEGKLNCLIFIPIVSQTYCDPTSYAWKHEFCAFNALASEDAHGRDIRLRNGNTASRILPVQINDLDASDEELLASELKTKMRPVDFIFRSPGVNRPLRKDDKRSENASKLFYRDQINKVANAVKEIINGMKYPYTGEGTAISGGVPIAIVDDNKAEIKQTKNDPARSIAVLPFVSLSHDSSQEYFADGITENIIIQLGGLRKLRVISRTSVMRYKKTTRSAPEIAEELGVKYLLEGSAQAQGNKVRINVQLIDAASDQPVWSRAFMESLDDIFAIQSSVAEAVAQELHASLNAVESDKLKVIPTSDLEAYDLFLKGRHAFNQWGVEGYRTATEYFQRALKIDPEFKEAYSYLASSYSARMSWNGDLSPGEALDKIRYNLDEAFKRGGTDNDYLTQVFIEFFVNKDFTAAERMLHRALAQGHNNASVYYTGSYLFCMMGRLDEALSFIQVAKDIEPNSISYFNYYGLYLYLSREYERAAENFAEALSLYPSVVRFYDHLGRIHVTNSDYKTAIRALDKGLRLTSLRPPSMIAYLAIARAGLQQHNEAEELLKELIQRSATREKGVNVYISLIYSSLNKPNEALEWREKARLTNDVDLIWQFIDPLLKRGTPDGASPGNIPDYENAEKVILDKLTAGLPTWLSYHNLDHINDVLYAAMTIAANEAITEDDVRLLRVAVLLHDAGFIISIKDHENHSCKIARDLLPSFGFDDQMINIVCDMILSTRLPQSPKALLEKIICDADLDYLGRDDFYAIGQRLFEELKSQKTVKSEREWNLIQKTFLESHRFHTNFSITHREGKKQQHLKDIVSLLQSNE